MQQKYTMKNMIEQIITFRLTLLSAIHSDIKYCLVLAEWAETERRTHISRGKNIKYSC